MCNNEVSNENWFLKIKFFNWVHYFGKKLYILFWRGSSNRSIPKSISSHLELISWKQQLELFLDMVENIWIFKQKCIFRSQKSHTTSINRQILLAYIEKPFFKNTLNNIVYFSMMVWEKFTMNIKNFNSKFIII